MINDRIAKDLMSKRDSIFVNLGTVIRGNKLLRHIFTEFSLFNFKEYQENLETEIRRNLEEWWVNPEKGIVKDEKLYAILFEFDTTWWGSREAMSYGINKWEDFSVVEEEFEMGNDYDFATEFYAAPGLTLNFYEPFEFLDDDSNLKKKHKKGRYLDLDGFEELAEYVKYAGYLKIQETFRKLHQEKLFKDISMKDEFMFIIEEHDMGATPLLVIEK